MEPIYAQHLGCEGSLKGVVDINAYVPMITYYVGMIIRIFCKSYFLIKDIYYVYYVIYIMYVTRKHHKNIYMDFVVCFISKIIL